jgi:hypothetical protein
MNKCATEGSTDKEQRPLPDQSLRSNLQTWLDAAQEASARTTTDNRRNLPTTPAAPDGAFKKGNDIVTPSPPKRGLGFSPRTGVGCGGRRDLNKASKEGISARGVDDVVATAS